MAGKDGAMDVLAGTSGYSYREWRGNFYPPELHRDEWLGYYASRLPTVEINNTFYRVPHSYVLETWRDSVPEGFRFVIKASRRITHQNRLRGIEEPLDFLLSRAGILGDKLGALLFQLPPDMAVDVERLRALQKLLPDELPVAFDFRHTSWHDDTVRETLIERGHTLVLRHDDKTGDTEPELLPVSLAYLQLRADAYSPAALAQWRQRLLSSAARQAFVFFKHEDAGDGARLAEAFMALGSTAQPKPASGKGRRGKQLRPRGAGYY